jgi:hypothetical protein
MWRATLTVLFLACASIAAAKSGSPEGRYCGTLASSGEVVDASIEFTLTPDGRLKGTYEFDDLGTVTKGTLYERTSGAGPTHTLEWLDKYGTGTLTITFDESMDSFSGKWGQEGEAPDQPWDGKRCDKQVTDSSFAVLIDAVVPQSASPSTS